MIVIAINPAFFKKIIFGKNFLVVHNSDPETRSVKQERGEMDCLIWLEDFLAKGYYAADEMGLVFLLFSGWIHPDHPGETGGCNICAEPVCDGDMEPFRIRRIIPCIKA